ncbi:MAG: S8 family serine peptidase, partial [Thermoplasmata archaeon]
MKKPISNICIALFLLTSLANIGIISGESAVEQEEPFPLFINLKAARFDPLFEEPNIPLELTYPDETAYYLVQCKDPIQSGWVEKILDTGAIILGYIPDYTYILHMEKDVKRSIENLPFIRWIGIYHPAYKIEENLLSANGPVQLNVMIFEVDFDTKYLQQIRDKITSFGGSIFGEEDNIIRTEIDASKIRDIAFIPDVEWIDEFELPVALMDNIRVFTGAESPLHEYGFTGTGIVGEVKDSGLDTDHPEFEGQLIGTDGSISEDSHGTSTFGIVFARGATPRAKGMLPGAQGVFASWGVGRKQSIANLVNNWGGLFQSNSWSSGSSDGSYSSFSRQNDEAIFEYDVTMLYASGNGGDDGATTQDSSAKNVIAVGALNHYDNKDRTDDQHTGTQGNKGPTDDGRIKPDVVGPFDSIYTTTSGDGYTSGFGGTSGATPIAAGAVGLIYEMYRENHFGNNPTGTMPHAATVKAILIADAYQYEFSQGDRFAQGWGLVDVGNVYNIGENHFIDDEKNALRTGDVTSYKITPTTSTPLKISLVWTDVPGTTSSSMHLINDLSLMVTDPNGIVYHGNFGLDGSKWSLSEGWRDHINNVENVFIENPISGEWTIEVIGENIPIDGVTETPEVDQSYALVASGVIKYEHDLRVHSLYTLKFVDTGQNVPINATIMNIGKNNGANIKVQFLVDNNTMKTVIIDSIEVGEVAETNFVWTPYEAREYYISVYVEPLSGETSTEDNRINSIIDASPVVGRVLVDDGHGTDLLHYVYYYHIEAMGPEKFRVFHTSETITTELLSDYDIFITAWPTESYTSEEVTT